MLTEFALIVDDVEIDSDVLPSGAGLAAVTTIYTGRHYRGVSTTGSPMTASGHALDRLAERGNVRTVDEMLAAIRSLWACALAIILAPDDAWHSPPHGGAWQVPVSAGVAVLAPHKNGSKRLAAVTVLSPEMANEAAVRATEALLAALTVHETGDPR